MYEELIKRLRNGLPCYGEKCFSCPDRKHCVTYYEHEAADAIDELTGFVQEAERDRDEYRERLDKANDAIEDLEKQLDEETEYATALACNIPQWIPVTERLPEEKDSGFSADVLILVKEQDGDFIWEDVYSGYYLYDAVSSETGWWAQMPQNCERVEERFSVTHWMPLPQPSKEET